MTTGFQEPRSPVGETARRAALSRRDGAGRSASDLLPREPRSYYGKPVIKPPVWTWEIPLYFVTGGISGASAGMCFAAGLTGNEKLAARAQLAAFATIAISPALLISDLGRSGRFYNMLRVFKPTSPMSVGSWLLAANGTATGLATLSMLTGRGARLRPVARGAAALSGLPLMTYTAVLIANTAVPVWHEGRHQLPFVFGGSSTAGAGALSTLITPHAHSRPARRMAVIGTGMEAVATQVMERRLGHLGEPLHKGKSGKLGLAAKVLASAGAGLVATLGRNRPRAARAGAVLVLAGELIERWSVFQAGFASAADPKYTVEPQRRRLDTGD